MLIQHINTADERGNRSGISDAIVELEQVTRVHFDVEDRLMVTYDYPDLVIHTAEHAKLLLEVQGYKDNAVFTTQQLARILFNWLTSHIMMVKSVSWHSTFCVFVLMPETRKSRSSREPVEPLAIFGKARSLMG